MLDQGIGMVRPACKEDGEFSFPAAFFEDFLVLFLDFPAVLFLGREGAGNGLIGRKAVKANIGEVFSELPFEQFFILEIDGRRVDGNLCFRDTFDDVGVARDYRAVIAVDLPLIILLFIDDIGHEDSIDPLLDEVQDMTMDKFGRKTDVVAHHVMEPCLIKVQGGWIGKLDLKAAGRKQGMPERIVLVHIEGPRQADGTFRFFVDGPVKEQVVFIGVDILTWGYIIAIIGKVFFALVARIIDGSIIELIFLDETVVFAAMAGQLGIFERSDMDHIIHGRLAMALGLGIKGAAVGSHDFRNVAAMDLGPREDFKGPDNGIVFHGAPLEHNLIAQFLRVLQFKDLI